jgi:hypothetical protein
MLLRYSLLAAAGLALYVALSFTIDLIFDGTVAIAAFHDYLELRLLFGAAWVVFMLIVAVREGLSPRRNTLHDDKGSMAHLQITMMNVN